MPSTRKSGEQAGKKNIFSARLIVLLLVVFGFGLFNGVGIVYMINEYEKEPATIDAQVKETDIKKLMDNASNAFHYQRDIQKTLDLYRRVLQLDPDNYDANMYISTLYSEALNPPDYGAAIYHTNRALRIKKDYMSLMGYGGLMWKNLDYVGAEQVFRDCVQLEPGQFLAWGQLAVMLEKQGKTVEALADYKKADELCQDAKVKPELEVSIKSLTGKKQVKLYKIQIH